MSGATTFSVMTLGITTLRKKRRNFGYQHRIYADILGVFILSIVMMKVIILSVVMLTVIMLRFVILIIIVLGLSNCMSLY